MGYVLEVSNSKYPQKPAGLYHLLCDTYLTALCDVLLFRDELFYYESFGLFAVLILVQLAATGVAAFHIYQEKKRLNRKYL